VNSIYQVYSVDRIIGIGEVPNGNILNTSIMILIIEIKLVHISSFFFRIRRHTKSGNEGSIHVTRVNILIFLK